MGVPYGEAYLVGILVERGELGEAARSSTRSSDQQRIGDGARLFTEASPSLLTAEGQHEEALAGCSAPRAAAAVVNPVWRAVALPTARRRSPPSGATTRPGR